MAVFFFVVQKCSSVNHLIRLCPETIGGRGVGGSRPQINSGGECFGEVNVLVRRKKKEVTNNQPNQVVHNFLIQVSKSK